MNLTEYDKKVLLKPFMDMLEDEIEEDRIRKKYQEKPISRIDRAYRDIRNHIENKLLSVGTSGHKGITISDDRNEMRLHLALMLFREVTTWEDEPRLFNKHLKTLFDYMLENNIQLFNSDDNNKYGHPKPENAPKDQPDFLLFLKMYLDDPNSLKEVEAGSVYYIEEDFAEATKINITEHYTRRQLKNSVWDYDVIIDEENDHGQLTLHIAFDDKNVTVLGDVKVLCEITDYREYCFYISSLDNEQNLSGIDVFDIQYILDRMYEYNDPNDTSGIENIVGWG